jgi:hypothetical protein
MNFKRPKCKHVNISILNSFKAVFKLGKPEKTAKVTKGKTVNYKRLLRFTKKKKKY